MFSDPSGMVPVLAVGRVVLTRAVEVIGYRLAAGAIAHAVAPALFAAVGAQMFAGMGGVGGGCNCACPNPPCEGAQGAQTSDDPPSNQLPREWKQTQLPENYPTLSEHKPNFFQRWQDSPAWDQQVGYGIADGFYQAASYLSGNYVHRRFGDHLGGYSFANADDRINSGLSGFMTIMGPMLRTLTAAVPSSIPGFRPMPNVYASGFRLAAKGGGNGISKIIDVGKQGKHIFGHNNYIPGRSILTEDAQGLLNAFHSGKVNSSQIINAVKTRVNFGKTIGNYIKDGVATPTTNGIIINAKNGVHIVPSAPY